jgi:hypothetical protein
VNIERNVENLQQNASRAQHLDSIVNIERNVENLQQNASREKSQHTVSDAYNQVTWDDDFHHGL